MEISRMSNADMLQYCDEALAWEALGPIDRFFFESVQSILLGQASAYEEPDDEPDDLMGVERPVQASELEPEYCRYADIYYEEGDDDLPDYSTVRAMDNFPDDVFSRGFFTSEPVITVNGNQNKKAAGFTVDLD